MTQQATVITGDQVPNFQGLVLRKAMQFYINHGMMVNRAYTPKNMLATASNITGLEYKRGKAGMAKAIEDLTTVCSLPPLTGSK